MITRKSFFIRWILYSSDNDEGQQTNSSIIDVEHIQSGSRRRVSSLEEASQWMREIEADGAEEIGKIERSANFSNY